MEEIVTEFGQFFLAGLIGAPVIGLFLWLLEAVSM